MKWKAWGSALLVLVVLLLAGLLIAVRSLLADPAAAPAASRAGDSVAAVPAATATALLITPAVPSPPVTPAFPEATLPLGANPLCAEVAPASRAACLAAPTPDPNFQGGVPAIQPSGAPTVRPAGMASAQQLAQQATLPAGDVTLVAISEAQLRAYITSHLTVNGGATPTISKVELLPASVVSARINGSILGPANALVYVVTLQGPITIDTTRGQLTGSEEQLIYSAGTGNYLVSSQKVRVHRCIRTDHCPRLVPGRCGHHYIS